MVVLSIDNMESMEFAEQRIEVGRNRNISKEIEIIRDNGSAIILFKNRKTVSRRHCEIFKQSSKWYIRDLGSTNGTSLNSKKLIEYERYPIEDGDTISIGSNLFIDINLNGGLTLFEDSGEIDKVEGVEKTKKVLGDKHGSYLPLTPLTLLHNGEYKVIEQLGSMGNFGIVYLGEALKSNSKKVFIKEYFPKESAIRKRGSNEVILKGSQTHFRLDYGDFKRGVEGLMRLSKHKNIVAIESFFEENGTAYYITDHIEGETLNEYLEKNHPLTQREIEGIIFPLFGAVKHLHKHNLLHGNINFSNILITRNMKPKLSDFGIVQGWLLESSQIAGFAPIEYYIGGVKGRYSDVYSLGMVTYALMNGITESHKLPTASMRLEGATPLKFPIKGKRISKKFMEALKKSLEIEPEDRPQNIDELIQLFKGKTKKVNIYFTIGVVLTLLLGLIIIFKTFQYFL
jgi:hypothetical protein